jgi:hypothetical protein
MDHSDGACLLLTCACGNPGVGNETFLPTVRTNDVEQRNWHSA